MKRFRFDEHRAQLRKLLVIELLGLGDNVHLLPALYRLRAALPEAELHVMARAHVADLFVVTPWVDRVWRYPVIPREPTLREHLELIRQLRAERFDLVINTSSNDRSGWLTRLTGAPRRVGRVPRKGRRLHWRLMHNYEIEAPYWSRPTWVQKLEALDSAGVPAVEGPPFRVEPPPLDRVDARVRALHGREYVHVSPFASEDRRGLPDDETAAMLNGIHQLDAQRAVVISHGPTARERSKWQNVQQQLRFVPAAVFAGDLDTVSFLRLVAAARLHVGPDSGGVHVARMFGVPTVSWIRSHSGTLEWIADEPGSHAFVSRLDGPTGVQDLRGHEFAAAVSRCLRADCPH